MSRRGRRGKSNNTRPARSRMTAEQRLAKFKQELSTRIDGMTAFLESDYDRALTEMHMQANRIEADTCQAYWLGLRDLELVEVL